MGDRPGSPSRVRMIEDKVRWKDMCWTVGIFLGPTELPGVGGPGLGEVDRYKWYQSRLSRFHGRVWLQLCRHGVHGWFGS
jgi:hypothetical protein